MTPEEIKTLVEAVVGLLVAITTLVTLRNNAHINAVRDDQKRVAQNLAQITQDGKELRDYLAKNADKGGL